MMWEQRLTESVTVWSTTPDGFGGVTFTAPRVIMGRWEDKNEKFTSAQGQELISKAVVILSCDVSVGDWLYRGESIADNPVEIGGLEVQVFNSTRDLRGMNTFRKAIL